MFMINIFSSDILYARMLMHEIKAAFGRASASVSVSVNDNGVFGSRTPGISILDLDSKYAGESFISQYVIGYSRDIESLNSKKYSFCKKIFARPFLIEEFLDSVLEAYQELCKETAEGKNDEEREITLVFGEDNNVSFCGNQLHLSKNEYDILSLLDGKRSECVSREEINHLLGGDCGNMCEVYICRLRGKLAEFSNEKLIYTVRNKGYMLKLK